MYTGPPIDDSELLDMLPGELRHLLERVNGYVAYNGGLHVRGACHSPEWHSLRAAWHGSVAIHRLFPVVEPIDIPFGEDALGDQYLLRNRVVHRLGGELGELESLNLDLVDFDAAVRADPVGFLGLAPLEAFRAQGGMLEPGELLGVYPPFVVQESATGVDYRAVPALERRRWLAYVAEQVKTVPNGGQIRFVEP